jgi:hypothetical protein
MTPAEWVLSAPTILTVAGLDFVVHNNGHHIVVPVTDEQGREREFHLWPSTGHWRVYAPVTKMWISDTKRRGMQHFIGVRGLIRYLQARNLA